MANSNKHGKQTIAQGIHGIIAYEYANATERLAVTEFQPEDLYKIAIQLEDNSLWVLYSISPVLWGPVGSNPNVIQGISAGTTQAQGPTVLFSNANGISFGANGHTITASVQPGGLAGLIAGTGTATSGTLSFVNGNGITFGIDGTQLTASILPGAAAGIGAVQAGTQTQTSGTLAFVNSNGLTFGMNNSSQVTGSYTVPSTAGLISNINVSAGNTSNNLSALTFNNGNNVSFGLNGSVITASVPNQTSLNFSNSNGLSFGIVGSTLTGSYTVPNVPAQTQYLFNNANGVTFGTNVSTVTASVAPQTAHIFSNSNGISFGTNGSTVTASYSVPTQSSLSFSNVNGVSFGLNGSTLTASVASQTNQTGGKYAIGNTTGQSSSSTFDMRSVSISGAGNISVGYSGNALVVSGAGGNGSINVSAGTTSNNLSALTFSNSNGLSFGLNGSAITGSYSTLVFSNSNGISFGINAGTLTATVQPGAAAGLAAIQAGTQTATSGTVTFGNSNGISFGMSGSSQITASYTVPNTVGLISAINVSGGTTSNNLTALTFSNSNNVSFGLNGSVLTASIPTQTSLSFSNLNGISFGLNGSTLTASYTVPSVPAQSNQTQGVYALGNTTGQSSSSTIDARSISINGAGNISVGYSGGSIVVSGNPQTIQTQNIVVPSAGTQTATSGTVVFGNSNGISFGMSNSSVITASYTVPNTAGLISNINVSAGTTSNNLNAITFSNSNGLAFGLNGSTITGSYTVPVQTNQTEGRYAIGNTTGQSSSSTFDARTMSISGAGNISVGYSGNALVISGSAANGNVNISAGTTSNNLTNFVFSNSNNVSFGLNGSTVTATVTVPAQTNQTVGIYGFSNTTGQSSSSTYDARSLSFHGGGVAYVGNSNGSILISVPAVAPAAFALSAGTTLASSGTLIFSNANGISFGIDGNTLTATVIPGAAAGIAAVQAGTQTATSGTVTFGNSNGISFGMSGSSQITASYTVPSTAGLISAINISGGTTSNNLSALTFNNGNGVTFGLNGSTLTASVASQTNQTLGKYAIGNTTGQSSSSTFDARTMSISGVGNISVGYSGNALVISGSAANGNVNISAGTTSNNLTNFVFSNSNNVSFGLNGSTITATITVPAQSNQTQGFYALGNTTQNSSTTLDARSLSFNGLGAATVGYSNGSIQISVPVQTVQTQSNIQAIYDGANSISTGTIRYSNSNGISFGINGQTLTASHNGITNINISAGTTSNNLSGLVFSNSNNVSFGLNGSTVTATVTVPAQSNQTAGLYALGNTTGQSSSSTIDVRSLSINGAGAVSVGYSGGSIMLSAPTQTSLSFSNLNGISFGIAGSTLTATYTVPSTAGLISAINISAGTTSNNLTALTFSNSNGIGFGLNGSVVTASYTVPTQTNQTLGGYAIGNTTGQSSSSTFDARTLSFSGAGVASVGYSGNAIVISVPAAGASINVSAGTTSNNLNAITFSNSNGLAFGLNGSTITGSYTVPTQTNQTVGLYALGNTTQNSSTTLDARTLSFNGLGAATIGYSNGSIQVSVPVQTVQTQSNIQAIYDGANSISTGTIRYSNSNGISFGINGQTLTASHNGITSQTNQTLGLYALGNTTGQSSSSTFDARTMSFSGAGGISVGYSGNNLVVSAPSVTRVSQLIHPKNPWQTNFSVSNANISWQHFNAEQNIIASQANILMALSGNTNSSGAFTISLGMYTINGSTMSLASSDSRVITWTSGSQTTASSIFGGISGTRYRTISLNNWNISGGDYVLGMWFRTTNDGTWRAFGQQGPTIVGAVDSNETNHYHNGHFSGSYTTAMIGSVNVTNTNYVRTGDNALQQPGVIFLGSY